jgi:hypothetical protein
VDTYDVHALGYGIWIWNMGSINTGLAVTSHHAAATEKMEYISSGGTGGGYYCHQPA